MAKFKNSIDIYYIFRCDHKSGVEGVVPDKYFNLDDIHARDLYKALLDEYHLNYDYLLEVFSMGADEILDNYYIVSNNHLNN